MMVLSLLFFFFSYLTDSDLDFVKLQGSVLSKPLSWKQGGCRYCSRN